MGLAAAGHVGASTYLTTATRSNQIVGTGEFTSLQLNAANFNLTAPNFVLQSGSTLLSGAVTGGRLTNSFFTATTYRGAFGTTDWTSGWTNYNPQNTDYDR